MNDVTFAGLAIAVIVAVLAAIQIILEMRRDD